MTDPRAKRPWHTKPSAEWCRLVRQCGKDGLAVTDAARRLGVATETFIRWERVHPAFGKAAQGVRKNSAERALSRTKKLMEKSEEKLLRALEHVRAERAAEEQRIRDAMASGRIWTPEQLAAKLQNLKELRREARAEARRNQRASNRSGPGVQGREARARVGELTIRTVNYVDHRRQDQESKNKEHINDNSQ